MFFFNFHKLLLSTNEVIYLQKQALFLKKFHFLQMGNAWLYNQVMQILVNIL